MSTTIVFQQMLIMLILISVGYILYKKGFITDEGSRILSFLVVNITNPCFVISSGFSDDGFDITHEQLFLGLIITALIYVIMAVFGLLMPRILRAEKEDYRFYEVMCVYSNVGFIGIPVAKAVLGSESIIYVTLFNIMYSLFFYTHGYRCILRDVDGPDTKSSLKKVINFGSVAAVITIILVWFNIQLPMIVEDIIEYTGRSTTFIAMVVLGVSFARLPIKKLIGDIRIYLMVVIRYLAFPIALAFILRHFLGDSLIVEVAALMTAMPAGNTPLMLAEENGLKTEKLSSGILVSTVLSVITVSLTAMAV